MFNNHWVQLFCDKLRLKGNPQRTFENKKKKSEKEKLTPDAGNTREEMSAKIVGLFEAEFENWSRSLSNCCFSNSSVEWHLFLNNEQN